MTILFKYIIKRHLTTAPKNGNVDYFSRLSDHGCWSHDIDKAFSFHSMEHLEAHVRQLSQLEDEYYPLEIITIMIVKQD